MLALLEMSLDEQLRAAIRESGKSANQLAEATGLHQTVISRFIRGASDIRFSAVIKMAEYFNLGLLPMPETDEEPHAKPTKKRPRS